MKTFGSGNALQKEWFIRQLKEATERGIIIVNITQCASGAVEMGRYETGMHLFRLYFLLFYVGKTIEFPFRFYFSSSRCD